MRKLDENGLHFLLCTLSAGFTITAALAEIFVKLLFREAVDREEPKLMIRAKNFLAGSGGQSPYKDEADAAAEALRARNLRKVEIPAWDGTKLVGHWRRHENPKRIILAMHGWRSDWARDFGASAEFWYDEGCSVLYAEQRGQGESGGEVMGFGLLERYDVVDWLRWIASVAAPDVPVYLAGMSMGATTVLMASALELPGNVHGIIADCGFLSADEIWRRLCEDRFHLRYAMFQPDIHRLGEKTWGVSPDETTTRDALANTELPVLLIHGMADRFVPADMTLENYAACHGPHRLLLVAEATHGVSYLADTPACQNALKSFWADFDDDAVRTAAVQGSGKS